MATVKDFFIPANTVSEISNEEYQKVSTLISSFDAISRILYHSLYIIDYSKKNFLYVSNNPFFLCSHSPQEVKEMGYDFYINHVPEKEQMMLTEINTAGFKFFEKTPSEEKIKFTISYDFHLISGNKKTLVNHKFTPIILNKEGKIWLAACVVSLASHSKPGNVVLRIIDKPVFWEYSFITHRWRENIGITLNEREKDTLILSAQGYSMKDIANKLFVALDTVRFYKKNIFEKLQVKNIVEALSFAKNYRLL